jgi:putative transposase
MGKAYTELYYHLVWATWKRNPAIRPEIQDDLYAYIAHKCKAYEYELYAVNGMEDHIHVVLRIDPTVPVAEAVGKLKGSASRFCNQSLDVLTTFQWQTGYAALTFGKRDLPKLVAYVQNQKVHHREAEPDNPLEALPDE